MAQSGGIGGGVGMLGGLVGIFGPGLGNIQDSNSAIAAPNAPSATDATAESDSTLTFPVTTSASGAVPVSIVVEQDIASAWTEIDVVTCTEPQGSPQDVVVHGLDADTDYSNMFRFKARNAGGTSGASSTVGGTTTSSGVTSITLVPADFLLDDDDTLQLAVFDQDNNDITADCTFNSSNTTAATVDSDGLVTPVNPIQGTILTATHTPTGLTATANCTTLKGGRTVMLSDAGPNYANNTALYANISTDVPGGTGSPSTALYTDISSGGHATNMTVSTDYLFNNAKVLRNLMAAGQMQGAALAAAARGASGVTDAWAMAVFKFLPGFTTVGTGGGSHAFKVGPMMNFNNGTKEGRAGIVYTNTDQLYSEALTLNGGTMTGGVDETQIQTAGAPEWNDDLWYIVIAHYFVQGGDMAIAIYRVPIGTNITQVGDTASGPMDPGVDPGEVGTLRPFGENMNQPNILDKYMYFAQWELIDGTIYPDPYGILGNNVPTLATIANNFIAQGDTGKAFIITGTNFVSGDASVIFSNAGITVNSTVVNSSTEIVVNLTASGTATTGAGTVKVNSALYGDSNTAAFTMVSKTVPVTSGLVCHLMADAGTSTTTDNTALTTWTDQSATGTAYTQATTANKPTYHTNAQNGRPVVRFDGTNDILAASGVVSALNTTNNTIFWAGKALGGSATERPVFANVDLVSKGFLVGGSAANVFILYSGDSSTINIIGGGIFNTNPHQETAVLNQSATNKQIVRVDGVQVATGTAGYTAQTTVAPSVGGLAPASYYFNGDLYEIVIYNVALTSTQITDVEMYLRAKWGLS